MRVLSRLMTLTNVNYTFRVIKLVLLPTQERFGTCVVLDISSAEDVLRIKEQRENWQGSF